MLVWQELTTGTTPDENNEFVVQLDNVHKNINVLTDGFTQSGIIYDKMHDYKKTIRSGIEQQNATMTLQFNGTVTPPDHTLLILFSDTLEENMYPLAFFFNDERGYINDSGIMWLDNELANTPGDLVIPNLLPCYYTDERWQSETTLEEKLWEQKYPSGRCDGKSNYAEPILLKYITGS